MSKFNDAIEYILQFEGGYTDGHNDLGGPTNWGISLNFLKHVKGYENATIETIKELTREEAIKLYKQEFWLPIYEEIENQWVVNYLFDMVINMGPANAHKTLQRSLWSLIHLNIKDDGVFGEITLNIINQVSGSLSVCHLPSFNASLRSQRCGYYFQKIAEHPIQKDKLESWLNRTYHSAQKVYQ